MPENRINKKNRKKAAGFGLVQTSVIYACLIFAAVIPMSGQIISISSKFDTTSIWIGEQTNFTIILEQPEGMYVAFPRLEDTLSRKIEILSAWPADSIRIGDNRLRINKSFRVTSFDRGEHYVEDLPFVFFADNEERVLSTHRVRLQVIAPETDQDAGIYDIKDPFGIPLGFFEILPWIILLLLAAMVSWYLIRYIRHKKEVIPPVGQTMLTEPPHVVAMRELKQLKSESVWQKGRVKEYYTRLTEIIRIYIEKRFRILAMERTSSEIIEELAGQNGIERRVVDQLEECLLLADLVKFAKGRPEEKDHESALNTAFHFVKATFERGFTEEKEIKDE